MHDAATAVPVPDWRHCRNCAPTPRVVIGKAPLYYSSCVFPSSCHRDAVLRCDIPSLSSSLSLNEQSPRHCQSWCRKDVTPLPAIWSTKGRGCIRPRVTVRPICVKLGKAVMGMTKGSDCYCGDLLPAANTKTDTSNCNVPCGGANAWTVMLTGLSNNVGTYGGSASSSSSSASSSSTSPLFIPEASSSVATAAVPLVAVPSTTLGAVAAQATTPAAVSSVAYSVVTVGGQTVVRTVAVTTGHARRPDSHSCAVIALWRRKQGRHRCRCGRRPCRLGCYHWRTGVLPQETEERSVGNEAPSATHPRPSLATGRA
ncbi:hypothetical protein MRB53_040379 [Persea americana]|nr:hypothetical protein MRB53_040379 [Persea americana]